MTIRNDAQHDHALTLPPSRAVAWIHQHGKPRMGVVGWVEPANPSTPASPHLMLFPHDIRSARYLSLLAGDLRLLYATSPRWSVDTAKVHILSAGLIALEMILPDAKQPAACPHQLLPDLPVSRQWAAVARSAGHARLVVGTAPIAGVGLTEYLTTQPQALASGTVDVQDAEAWPR